MGKVKWCQTPFIILSRVMLRELNEFGFTNLTGIDYSESSIQLAKEICAEFDCTLKQQDILQMNQVRHDLISLEYVPL